MAMQVDFTKNRIKLVVGASQGIGLALVKRILLEEPMTIVVGTARDEKSPNLVALSKEYPNRVYIESLDLLNDASKNQFIHNMLQKFPFLDLYVHNSGIINDTIHKPRNAYHALDTDAYFEAHRVNVLGPQHIFFGLLPLIKKTHKMRYCQARGIVDLDTVNDKEVFKKPINYTKIPLESIDVSSHSWESIKARYVAKEQGPVVSTDQQQQQQTTKELKDDECYFYDEETYTKVVFVGSMMGSMGLHTFFSSPIYRTTKSALLHIAKDAALVNPFCGIQVVHPGYVVTTLTRGNGDITPEQSAMGLYYQIQKQCCASNSMRNGMVAYDGTVLPW